MELQDPYAAPATLPVAPPVLPVRSPGLPDAEAVSDAAVYYAPPSWKIIVLSLTTLSLYPIYWFWRNWQAIKRETGGTQWPWARALFAPIWSYFCFSALDAAASSRRRNLAFAPGLLAAAFFLLNLASRLPNAGWMVALFTFVPILPVNSLLRRYHSDERVDTEQMDRFGVWHIVVSLLGGFLLLLAVIGTVATGGR